MTVTFWNDIYSVGTKFSFAIFPVGPDAKATAPDFPYLLTLTVKKFPDISLKIPDSSA